MPRNRGTVARSRAPTDPMSTAQLEAAAAEKPTLVKRLVMGVLPGLILTMISGIVAATLAFFAMQSTVSAQTVKLDANEMADRQTRQELRDLVQTVAKLASNTEARDKIAQKFWTIDWPQLIDMIKTSDQRQNEKVDRLSEKVDRLLERPR